MLKNATILVLAITTASLLFISSKDTEKEDQALKMEKSIQVYPVPIPSHLSFAEESLPLNKYGIKERLDRELLVNTYWQSNTMLMLKRSKRVFNIIEPILAQYGIPDHLYSLIAPLSWHQKVGLTRLSLFLNTFIRMSYAKGKIAAYLQVWK